MTSETRPTVVSLPALQAALWMVVGWGSASMTVETLLESVDLAATFISREGWQAVVEWLGGQLRLDGPTVSLAEIGFWPVAALVAVAMAAGWGIGVAVTIFGGHRVIGPALAAAGTHAGRCACLIGLWFFVWLTATTFAWERTAAVVDATIDLWCAVALAAWGAGLWGLSQKTSARSVPDPAMDSVSTAHPTRTSLACVLAGIALYTVVYT
ncbi:MAG: hypothetical protein KF861_24545, partial [Planctomycetaceae bacterium]|nr:hypothetical protein [Planctomycetaceae bacterium]